MAYNTVVLADSPAAYYRMDDTSGSVLTDASGNARNGVIPGSPQTPLLNQTGLLAAGGNASMDFDGASGTSGDYCNIADAAWMDSVVGLECLIRPDVVNVVQNMLDRDSTTSGQRDWQFLITGAGKVQFFWWDSGGTTHSVTGATTLVASTTYHVFVELGGSDLKVYLNGVQDGAFGSATSIRAVATDIQIGRNRSTANGAQYFNGRIDEVAFYTSAIGSTRIAAHALAAFTPELSGSLTGSGALSALVVPVIAVAASLTGSGVFSAATVEVEQTAANLTGSGAFSAVVQGLTGVAADLTGSGAFTATTVEVEYAAANLTGAGAFSASAFPSFTVAAPLTGSGVFSADVEDASAPEVDADLTGSGAFTAVVQLTDVTYTDTSNDDDGIYLGDGYAEVIWEPDVVEPPFFVGPLLEDQVRTAARCIDTAPGALPAFTAASARVVYAPAARDRVTVNNVDMTYWNGAAVQIENMKLIDPLLYGGCRITFPGINPQFPDAALGDLVTRFRFARVKIQRVLDGEVISTDSKGFVSRVDTSGTSLSLEVGGQAAGALSQMYVPPAVFRRKQDVEHICADLLRDARVQAKEHDGTSGVGLIKRGGSDGLTIFNETVAVWAGATGQAVTWGPNANGVYRKTQKSDTIVATAYIDSSLVTQSLAQDFMEQYTRIYARGFTANGEIVTNIKTPGLDQGDAPAFPLASGTLEVGMTDDDTTSGAGVTAAQQQLAIHNFLDFEDTTHGIFDALTERAVAAFQDVAGLNVTGEIGGNTWDALWNLEAIGYSLDESREYPMAQDARTFKWFRTANGSKKALNPDYDPHFIPNDLPIDVGGPFGKGHIRDFAASKLSPDAGVWTGTLTFRSGLIWGDHSPGDPLVADDVMDRRDLLPNMRLKLPHFAGGISVYVAGVDHSQDETTCLVSEVPATTMEVWQAIERRREAKSNPGRAWSGHTRASQVRNDVAVQWDTRGGRISTKRALVEGWNEIQVPVGQAGIVQSIRAQLQTPDEFAMLLTQKPVSVSALNNNPHTATPLTDSRPSARPWFEQESVIAWLEDRLYLDAWGTEKQPCGYDPSRKTDEFGPTAQPITGLAVETAGFNYETGSEPVLYLYVWVGSANNLLPGRILKNQRTTDF